MEKPEIVLASQSVRRKRLLKQIIRRFECAQPREPALQRGRAASEETLRLAKAKAKSVADRHPGAIVISADTLLMCKGKILGKPRNRAQAKKMLTMVSGQRVLAVTSICVFSAQKKKCWSERATVWFRPIGAAAMERYLLSGKWKGKAGGFNVERRPARNWVKKISGDKNVVIGLPLTGLENIWKKKGAAGFWVL